MAKLSKIMAYAGIGALSVVAAPFTAGGSLVAGAGLSTAIAGAGAVAVAGVGEANNEKIKKAKEASFADGVNEGKVKTVQEIKKHTNFYLATTALSYYVARCDSNISVEEEQEIAMDLDAVLKNKDIPETLKNEMNKIKNKKDITFEEVKTYLDKVGLETLEKLQSDVNEIIEADSVITKEEAEVKAQFASYLKSRS